MKKKAKKDYMQEKELEAYNLLKKIDSYQQKEHTKNA